MTFAKFCEAALDTPLTKYQKRTCDAIEEKYRKDGDFDSSVSTRARGGTKTLVRAQLIALFSLYLKCEDARNKMNLGG